MNIKALGFTLLLAAAPVWAEPPSEESLRTLLERSDMEHAFQESRKDMPNMVAALLENSLQTEQFKRLPPQQAERFKALVQKYATETAQEIISSKEIQSLMATAYINSARKHYTQAEVDAMNRFLATPEGKSINRKQPKVMSEFISEYSRAAAPLQNQIMREKMDKMEQELQALIKEFSAQDHQETRPRKR